MQWEILGESSETSTQPFILNTSNRRQQTYVIGRNGTGKSTTLARLALADIARGDGGMLLDPHGDLVKDVIDHCPDDQRHRLIYLDFTDTEQPVPFNLFECRADDNRDLICSELIGVWKHLFGDSWGFHLEALVRNLTLTMLSHQHLDNPNVPEEHRYNATMREAHDILFDPVMRKEYYQYIENPMVLSFWQDEYDNLGATKKNTSGNVNTAILRFTSSTTNKLRRFLLNDLIFNIVANRDRHNPIDLRDVMDKRQYLLVNLSRGEIGVENSALLGALLTSRLVVAALSRAQVEPEERDAKMFHVIADEFHRFATESFDVLLSEARKYAVTLTIAHQYRDQLSLEMKGSSSNCGSTIAFRVIGKDGADVAREYDATPQVRGQRYEPMMHSVRHVFTDEGAYDTDPRVIELKQLIEERRREYDRLKEMVRKTADVPAARLLRARMDELEPLQRDAREELRGLWAEFKTVLYTTYRRDTNDDGDAEYELTDQLQTFAEREREIANELTQLPNHTAMVRLADGSQFLTATLAMPPRSSSRGERVEQERSKSRRELAVPSRERRSVLEQAYLRQLRRLNAEEYEAELDEQPVAPL